jgi:alanine racemase
MDADAELATAAIDLHAITHNLRTISAVAGTELMAVVKANGFGHGATAVARTALDAGATWLGVTSAAEALALRSAGTGAPILSWLHRPDADFGPLVAANVDIGVSTVPHLWSVARAAAQTGVPAAVQLKVDTGLSRNGASGDDWPDLVSWAAKCQAEGTVRVRAVWSHLTDADQPGRPTFARQLSRFNEAVALASAMGLDPDLLHLANSAAALAEPRSRFGMCRIGLALYGVDPFGAIDRGTFGLRPAMTLSSHIVNLKRVPAGTGVSYGPNHVTSRRTTLALVPIGYADGLSRTAEGRAQVWVAGRRCPIVGRIAMDQCVVDVGDAPVGLGDPVTIFGPGSAGGPDSAEPTVAEWAQWAGTSPHEILTGIGSRVGRRYRRS